MMQNPWLIFIEILIAGAILVYLFFRRRPDPGESGGPIEKVEVKLSGEVLKPSDVRVRLNRPVQILVHRFDREPEEELFEIDDLQVYALLPALHTTIIPFNPQKRGTFPIVLGGERRAGAITVE